VLFSPQQIGILVLQKRIKELTRAHIPIIGSYFDQKLIYDWGVCDSLSSRVICEIIKKDTAKVTHLDILAWKDSDNLWKQRSSCISFVKIARFGQHTDTILRIAQTCVKNNERFVQLGTGYAVVPVFSHCKLTKVISGGYCENYSSQNQSK